MDRREFLTSWEPLRSRPARFKAPLGSKAIRRAQSVSLCHLHLAAPPTFSRAFSASAFRRA